MARVTINTRQRTAQGQIFDENHVEVECYDIRTAKRIAEDIRKNIKKEEKYARKCKS